MTTTRRGRPADFHRCSWDNRQVINDLVHQKDGRWRIVSTGVRFSEPDERKAIARFHAMVAAPNTLTVPVAAAIAGEPDLDTLIGLAQYGAPDGWRVEAGADGRLSWTPLGDESIIWAWVAEQIDKRPEDVARRTGKEWIAWHAHQPPAESPSLKSLGDLYFSRTDLSENELSRSKLQWAEFCGIVEASTVRELTAQMVEAYETKMSGSGLAPKSLRHRYNKVRGVVRYAIKRQRGVEDCRRALDILAMLEVKQANHTDPQPIDVADFWQMYAKAVELGDSTFACCMLLALNMAGYSSEVSAVLWGELDLEAGTLVTRRNKTGVTRVAVLWPETIEALQKLEQHDREELFFTSRRSYTTFSVLEKWRHYREACRLGDDVVYSGIRDAAYSVAMRTSFEQAEILAGHKLPGTSDHYLRRNPELVREACDLVRKTFAVSKHAK